MRTHKVTYFDSEGREHLSLVIKSVKLFLRGLEVQKLTPPRKIVFLTVQGEGPMLAYNNQLHNDELSIIAVTFPRNLGSKRADGSIYIPEIPDKVRKFFAGVGIPIITSRLPFDLIMGCDAHNREVSLLIDALTLFGGGVPLAIQAVLQATDAGEVEIGEQVIAVTGDTALLVTATTTQMLLRKDHLGFSVNEIICKPHALTQSRPFPKSEKVLQFKGGTEIAADEKLPRTDV